MRRLDKVDPEAPVPPPLPPGRTVVVPGIGEVFVRSSPPVPGSTPLLLLHGWMVTGDLNWFRCYERLQRDREIIIIDHQGHGRGIRSEQQFSLERCADAAAGVLRELGIERAMIAGYSMGGPIALHLTHRHRDLVAGLVLGATALEWRAGRLERAQWRLLPVLDLLSRFTTGRGVAQRTVRQAIDEDPSLAPWRPWMLAEMQRGHVPDLIDAGRALASFDARTWASGDRVPTAVILTTQDRLVRPRKQRQLADRLGATVHEIAGDHDTPLVHAEPFVEVLVQAVSDLSGGRETEHNRSIGAA